MQSSGSTATVTGDPTLVTTATDAGVPTVVTIQGGKATAASGGLLAVTGGAATGGSQTAGAVSITGGVSSAGSGTGGAVSIVGGKCVLGVGGDVVLRANTAAANGVLIERGTGADMVQVTGAGAVSVTSGSFDIDSASVLNGHAPSITVKSTNALSVISASDEVNIDSLTGIVLTTDNEGAGSADAVTLQTGTTTGLFGGADMYIGGAATTDDTSIGGDAIITGGASTNAATGIGGAVSVVGGNGGSGADVGGSIVMKVCCTLHLPRLASGRGVAAVRV